MSKPIIRHCFNCKYCEKRCVRLGFSGPISEHGYCNVRYRNIRFPKRRAEMCRFYDEKKLPSIDE